MIHEYSATCGVDLMSDVEKRAKILKEKFIKYFGRSYLTRVNIMSLAIELNRVMESNIETPCHTDKITFTKDVKICLSSHYFKNREGVTFWKSGEIGFAGWASDHNYGLVCDAFEKWLEKMEKK